MNAPLRYRQVAVRVDPLEVFVARAEARALLWHCFEFDLPDAVDELQAAAERDGLIERLGQDEVQAILRDAFHAVRDEPVPTPCAEDFWAELGWCEAAVDYHAARGPRVSLAPVSKPPQGVPTSTLQAAEFLLQQKDPGRLRRWLSRHRAAVRKAILRHLQQRKKGGRNNGEHR